MRNKFSNNPGLWGWMIVVTLASIQHAMAAQTARNVGYRFSPVRQETAQTTPIAKSAAQQEGPTATQVESIPTPDEPRVEIYVDDRFTGWQSAGQNPNAARLADDLRANWVMVDDNGKLSGQILGLKTEDEKTEADAESVAHDARPQSRQDKSAEQAVMNVYLLNRGRLLGTARLNAQNRFEFQGVKPGNYALIGYGKGGFFAFGFNVIPFAEKADQPRELYVPAVPTSGKSVTDWVTSSAPDVRFRQLGKHRFGQGKDDPPRLYGITGLRTFVPQATPATTIVTHPAALNEDGRLIGRIHHVNSADGRPQDLRTTTVQLVQQEKVVQQTGTDNYGVFEFSDIEPGSYELRAAGPDGLGAIGIEVVKAGEPNAETIDISLISSETIGWLNHFMHESAYLSAISGPRTPEKKCDRCGQRCPHCGGCHCSDNPCRCGLGYMGYGEFGSEECVETVDGSFGYGDGSTPCPCGGNPHCPRCHGGMGHGVFGHGGL